MKEGKVFNDPIHGHITIHPLAVAIIDTPQFQRLRDISQLGGVYYVFPAAASKRFEHSLGVSYLARLFVEKLHEKQPELGITESDMLCVEIAGLIHDLGHGPFSHLYDGKFLSIMKTAPNFEHEHASIGIFDILIEDNNLMPIFKKYGLDKEDIHFIKELVLGDKEEAPESFTWKGRGDKTFLYDIVANKRNGIDVDKFDYFARDCHVLGVTKSFDSTRLMKFAGVYRVNRSKEGTIILPQDIHRTSSSQNLFNGESTSEISPTSATGNLEVCFHIKEAWNIHELFHTRYALHKRAYQHRVSTSVELMITEILLLADPYIKIPSLEKKTFVKMSQCPSDLNAYWKLGEYLLKVIEHSFEDELEPARQLISRIRHRDLFPFIGEVLFSSSDHGTRDPATMGEVFRGNSDMVKSQIYAIVEKMLDSEKKPKDFIKLEDIVCVVVKLGYGKGGRNPVTELTTFYKPIPIPTQEAEAEAEVDGEGGRDEINSEECINSNNTNNTNNQANLEGNVLIGIALPQSISRLIPQEFEEIFVRIFCRFKNQKKIIGKAFDQWCSSSKLSQSLTPSKVIGNKRSFCE